MGARYEGGLPFDRCEQREDTMTDKSVLMLEATMKGRFEHPSDGSYGDVQIVARVPKGGEVSALAGMLAGVVEELVDCIVKETGPLNATAAIGVEITETLIRKFEPNEREQDAALETCATMLLSSKSRAPLAADVRNTMASAMRAAKTGDVDEAIAQVRESLKASLKAVREETEKSKSLDPAQLLKDALSKGEHVLSGVTRKGETTVHDFTHVPHPDNPKAMEKLAKVKERMPKPDETPDKWFERQFGRPLRSMMLMPKDQPEMEQVAESMFMSGVTAGKIIADMDIKHFALAAAAGFAKAVIEVADTSEDGELWLQRAISYLAMNLQANQQMRAEAVAKGESKGDDTIGKTMGSA